MVGVDGAVDLEGEGLLGELVGDGQDLERPEVGGLVEAVVDGPDLIGPTGSQAGGRDRRVPDPVPLLRTPEHAKSLVTAETLDALVVHTEPLLPEEGGHPAIAIAGTLLGQLWQPGPDALLCIGDRRRRSPLGGAGLAHQSAGPALGEPVSLLDHLDSPTAPCRAQKFPSATSFSLDPPIDRVRGSLNLRRCWLQPWRDDVIEWGHVRPRVQSSRRMSAHHGASAAAPVRGVERSGDEGQGADLIERAGEGVAQGQRSGRRRTSGPASVDEASGKGEHPECAPCGDGAADRRDGRRQTRRSSE